MIRDRLTVVAVGLLAVAGGGCASAKKTTNAVPVAPASADAAGTAQVVTAADYKFRLPAGFAVKAGPKVVLALDNQGRQFHELEVFDSAGKALGEIPPVAPGKKGAAAFDISTPGTYLLVCGVDDHKARGMFTKITVS